jgi:hypothetical protein
MSVSFECCVLSGRGLCAGLITRPEESYRKCGWSERYREASKMRRACSTRGCHAMEKKLRKLAHNTGGRGGGQVKTS